MRKKSHTLSEAKAHQSAASFHRLQRQGGSRRRSFIAAPTPQFLPVAELSDAIESHLTDFANGDFSPRTTEKKRGFLSLFLRWAQKNDFEFCDEQMLKAFFTHLNRGHEQPGGLWGTKRSEKALRPSTKETYYRVLGAFFNWMIREEKIKLSPLKNVATPRVPDDQIKPMTLDDIEVLIRAAKQSRDPKRNVALIKVMVDTGLRASEVCGLQFKDIDFKENSLGILGKGNKIRYVYMDKEPMKAITEYLQMGGPISELDDSEPIFLSMRGTEAGQALNSSGLRKLIRRLGKVAGLRNVRCSPHTLRHTYAVESLKAGCSLFALQKSLGHSSLAMTRRYVSLTEADLKNQHRTSSPIAGMRNRKKK